MSLKSTLTNVSVNGWSAIGSSGSDNYPYTLSQTIISPGVPATGWGNQTLSGDGNYLVVATPGAGSSSRITVYYKSSNFTLQQSFVTSDGPVQVDSVGIDYTGSTIVIGAPYSGSGAVYVFTRSGTTWSQLQKITKSPENIFGQQVCISQDNNYIMVSDPLYPATNQGSVYVYVKSGSTYTLQQTITSPFPVNNNQFGYQISTNDLGSVLAISEPYSYADQGRVYIYTRSGTTWSLQQTLVSSDIGLNDQFGTSMKLDSTGQYCVIGTQNAPGYITGRVYTFQYSGSTWNQISRFNAISTSMAISDTASVILVGDPDAFTNKGQVQLYCRIENNYVYTQTIIYPSSSSSQFGAYVSITNNSKTIAIGDTGIKSSYIYITDIFS